MIETTASTPTTSDAGAGSTAERLTQIALQLFAERGYAGTSLAAIAKRLGIRKPSLYNYYGSKDELFLVLFEESLERWKLASLPPLEAPGTCQGRLKKHFRASWEFATEDPHTTALCRAAVSQANGEIADKVQILLDRYRDLYQKAIHDIFTEAMDEGEIPHQDPLILVLAWLAFKDGVMTRQVFQPHAPNPFLDHFDGLWELFWRGIQATVDSPETSDDGGKPS